MQTRKLALGALTAIMLTTVVGSGTALADRGTFGQIDQPTGDRPTPIPTLRDGSPGPIDPDPAAKPTGSQAVRPTVIPTIPIPPTAPTRTTPGTTPTTGPTSTTPPPTATALPPTSATSAPGPTTTLPVPTGPVTATAPPSLPGTPGSIASRSGLPWASGVFIAGDNPAGVEAFAAWRGRPVDVAVTWSARTTWADIVSPSYLYQAWAATPYTMVLGVAPIPEGDDSTLAGCAAGDYNAQWTQFATNIKAAGMDGRSIIRLGWEFNGDWYKWQAGDPAAFAACWRQIYTTTEAVAPALRWDWNVNRGPGQSVTDARAAYPGDAYVDYVGVDSYDVWPAATDEAGWQQQYAGPYGLKFWADFAALHGKQLSVPEWGVYPGTASSGQSGGDNPFYIAKMEAFFRSLGSELGYESYFNESASYYAGSLFAPAQNVRAAAQYRQELAAS